MTQMAVSVPFCRIVADFGGKEGPRPGGGGWCMTDADTAQHDHDVV